MKQHRVMKRVASSRYLGAERAGNIRYEYGLICGHQVYRNDPAGLVAICDACSAEADKREADDAAG